MRELLPAAGCRHTPDVTAFDARGLAVREIGYWRDSSGSDAEPRIERHCHGASQRRVRSIDARLFMLDQASKPAASVTPNFRYRLSLAGRELRIDSIDAGKRITVYCTTGSVRRTRDARGSEQSRDYDVLGRPFAVRERLAGAQVQCVERFGYGESNTAAGDNQRGRLVRHDEPIGSRSIDTYALGGKPMRECLRLISSDDAPDWPCPIAERETLLEPGDGHLTRRRVGALGNVVSQIDATANIQLFGYNLAGWQNAVDLRLAFAAQQISIASELSYDAAGRLTRSRAGNGVLTEYRYAPADGRLTNCRATRPEAPTIVQDIHYRYDPAGNIVRREDLAQKTGQRDNGGVTAECTYAYDSLYQLIESTGREMAAAPLSAGCAFAANDLTRLSRYRRRFAYDAGGNLISLQHRSAATRASFTRRWTVNAGSNRIESSRASRGAEQTSDFDPMGNMRRSPSGKLLVWDARNQLQQAKLAASGDSDDGADGPCDDAMSGIRDKAAGGGCGERECYGYDGSGQRVRKIREWAAKGKAHRDTARYLPGLELRQNATGELLRIVVVSGPCAARIFHWESPPPSGLEQDHIRYSLTDHLGSGTQELSDRGRSISYEEYYPFGSTAIWATSSVLEGKYKTIRYSGRERDVTGLYYYGFRYYDGKFCRWLNPDPAGTIDGLNLFCFVRNNPVTWRDVDGRSAENRKLGFIYLPFSDKDMVYGVIGLNAQKIMRGKPPMGVLVDTEQDKADLMVNLAALQNEAELIFWGHEVMKSPSEEWGTYDPLVKLTIAYACAANQLQTTVLSAERDEVFSQLEPGRHKLHIAAHGDPGWDSLADGSRPQPRIRSIASVADAMVRGNGLRLGFDDIRLISCGSASASGNHPAPAQLLADRLGEAGLSNITVTGYLGKRNVHAMEFGGHKTQKIESRGPDPIRSSEARVRFRRANFTLRY